jgi:5-methylcytosine-specific restriction endonuclease McrA
VSRYQEYLTSDAWIERRDRVLKRAKGLCEKCGRQAAHVHHKTYVRIYNEADDDLIAICVDCHSVEHHRVQNLSDVEKIRRRQQEHSDRQIRRMYSK